LEVSPPTSSRTKAMPERKEPELIENGRRRACPHNKERHRQAGGAAA